MNSLTAVLGAFILAALTAAAAPDENFQIYLCFGQSNMEGFPGIPDEEKAFADPRFQVLAAVDFPSLNRTTGNWSVATPPLCRPNTGLSPADYFGRTLIERLPSNVRVGVVNVAVAGAKIELFDEATRETYLASAPAWMKGIVAGYGGSPYRHLVAMAKEAQRSGVIRGILLHQGESNGGDRDWPAKVEAIYTSLLRDLDLDALEVPLLVGELVHSDQQGAAAGMNEIIATLPARIPTAHVISSAGCVSRPDKLHFAPEGYRELGRRYGEAMSRLLRPPHARTVEQGHAP